MKTKTRFHKLTAWVLTLAMLMTFIPSFTFTAFAAEDTDYTGYYKIGNAGQLSWFACLVVGDTSQAGITEAVPNAKAVLTADIDIAVLAESWGKTWSGIGTVNIPFTGIFDGNGYTIKGLTINSTLTKPTVATIPVTTVQQGLFGVIGSGGVVRDVVLEGTASVSDGMKLGAVCSENNGTIENVLSMMTVTGGDNPSAFVHTNNGTITNCYTNQNGTATGATIVSSNQLKDGSVTYALGASFGQTIDVDIQPVHYDGTNRVYKTGDSYSNTEAVSTVTTYDLYIGGVQFTSENLEIDSTDNADITAGLATYDPDTNTLILDGFTYIGTGDEYNNAIVLGTDSFNIQLVGANKLENTSSFGYGLCGTAYTDITISGDGSLDITGVGNYGINTGGTVNISSDVSIINDEYGISADQVNISSGTVSITVNGECAGIETVYDTEISGGSVTIYSRYGNGITSDYGNVLMSDATVNIEAGYHGIYAASGVSMEDCDKVTIKANDESGVYSKDTVDITNCSKVEIQVTYEYGIYARDDVAISNSGVNITSGNHGIYTATKEDAEVHIKEKSVVTIDAGKNGIRTAKEDCPVTISASTVSITNSNYGIYTKDDDSPVTIENGSIVTISSRCYGVYASDSSISVAGSTVTAQSDEDGAFDSEPNIPDYDAVYIWYGDSEAAALDNGAQDISLLEENYSRKYVKIAPVYTVSFNTNGGDAIAPITATLGEKYGTLPSSAITGLSGGNKNWYLVDSDGNVTETNIKNLTLVSTARDHTLFIKRSVLAPNVSIALTVPGGISNGYQYYIPGASQRVLTATVGNMNTDILTYTYQWYKDDVAIEGATDAVLTLDGNVADAGTYKVKVTATLKDESGIVVTENTASAEKEQVVKIMHAANTLYYDANGGEGGPSNNSTGGTEISVQTSKPTRKGYIFGGWNTEADGTGESYDGGTTYTFENDNGNGGCSVTLYAKWEPAALTGTVTITGEAKYGETLTATVTDTNNTGTLSYQWYRHNEASALIEGATGSTYTITEDDIRWTIYCVVSSSVQSKTIRSDRSTIVPFLDFPDGAVSANGYTGVYDGKAHSITVTAPEGASVFYGTSADDFKSNDAPSYRDVGNYTVYYRVAKDNYASFTGSAVVTITNAAQDAPVVIGVDETINKKADGKITGLTSAMEYRMEGESTYTAIQSEELTNLAAGTYYVRFAAKANYNASADTKVVIGAGRMLKVTVVNGDGYTITVDKTEIAYMDGPTITLKIANGYVKTEQFDVLLNGNGMNWSEWVVNDVAETMHNTEDITITVVGVADITAPLDTENTEKVKDVTAENVTPDDKTDLEKAKDDLEKALEEHGNNMTADEKKAIEDEIKRIEDALEVIGNVEAAEELIDKLPENITKNDEAAIKAADDAYNALTDYEKSLVDKDAKKALDDAKAALTELNKPADTTSPNTGDNSNMFLWIALLFISGGAVITLTVYDKKRKFTAKR